jgi:hypothetical protein
MGGETLPGALSKDAAQPSLRFDHAVQVSNKLLLRVLSEFCILKAGAKKFGMTVKDIFV